MVELEKESRAQTTPEGVVSLMEAGDLKIELSTVQEETLFDQNEDVLVPGDGCYCNPGSSCC